MNLKNGRHGIDAIENQTLGPSDFCADETGSQTRSRQNVFDFANGRNRIDVKGNSSFNKNRTLSVFNTCLIPSKRTKSH